MNAFLNLSSPSKKLPANNTKISLWLTLVRLSVCLSAERCLEDHELVVQVQASMSSDSKFLFRKNYAKYEFFRNPLVSLSHPRVDLSVTASL